MKLLKYTYNFLYPLREAIGQEEFGQEEFGQSQVNGQNTSQSQLPLDGNEIYRQYTGSSLTKEREAVHISEEQKRFLLVETLTVEDGNELTNPEIVWRYQLDNHLGTSCIETDEQANLISYEEYHPFGSSAYRAKSSQTEASDKRYRYNGKEKSETKKAASIIMEQGITPAGCAGL